MPLCRRAAVHVGARLLQTLAQRLFSAPVQQLALDHHRLQLRAGPAGRSRGSPANRPDDQQIRAHPTQAVLPLDAAAAVDDALQKRLQQQLRAGLPVLEPLHPVLGVLPEERLERGQQLSDLQRTVLIDVPGRVVVERHLLRGVGEVARDDLPVDRVGNGDRTHSRHETQIAHVLQIVGGERLGGGGTAQQRLDHPAHPLFLKLVRELVQMRIAAQDQLLAGILNGGGADCTAAVPPGLILEAGLVRQRVHQPRLPAGQLPELELRLRRETLTRLARVLGQQMLDLGLREVAEPQGLRPDVEGAATGDDGVLTGGANAVVAHVAHAAQNHALGKVTRASRVAGPQLAQHGQQGVAYQRVDLVDQKHQRFRVRPAPAGQGFPERIVRAGVVQHGRPRVVQEPVIEGVARFRSQCAENGAHRRAHVLPRGLADLDVDVHAAEIAARVQLVPQRQQRRRLARLAGRVQHEVLPLPHEQQEIVDVEPRERRDVVVDLRLYRTGGVEETHARSHAVEYCTSAGPNRPVSRSKQPHPHAASGRTG